MDSEDNSITLIFSISLFFSVLTLTCFCLSFSQWWPLLCSCAGYPAGVCKEEAETSWVATFLKPERWGGDTSTSRNKCYHVQRGRPPHLSWIQTAQTYRFLHPYASPHILIPSTAFIVATILQQTPWNPGEQVGPQDSERLRKGACSGHGEQRWNKAAPGVCWRLPQQQQWTQGWEPAETGWREPVPNWHPLLGRVADLRQWVRLDLVISCYVVKKTFLHVRRIWSTYH